MGTSIGWRPAFGLLIVLSAIVFVLSFQLKPDQVRPEIEIDLIGVILVGLLSAMILSSIAANPQLPSEVYSQIGLDNINLVSNDQLQSLMADTTATSVGLKRPCEPVRSRACAP